SSTTRTTSPVATPQLNAALVKPVASASIHKPGERSTTRQASRWVRPMVTTPSAKNSSVAHSGCSPSSCRRRKGHHDSPQMKALNNKPRYGIGIRKGIRGRSAALDHHGLQLQRLAHLAGGLLGLLLRGERPRLQLVVRGLVEDGQQGQQ